MNKFGRNYILIVQKKDRTFLEIRMPFTLEFDVHRNSFSSANAAQFRIYNLSKENRSQIRKDQFDTTELRAISFLAGYENNYALAFSGNITQAWSVREDTNMISQIESFDGGFAYVNAITNQQYPSGTPESSIIDSIVQNMSVQSQGTVNRGTIGTYPNQISRGNSYNGSSTDILTDLTGGGFFIDNGKVNCLSDKEALLSTIPVISPKSGLLGTPVKENTYITLDMLFEPNLKVGQLVKLESMTADDTINGLHKIITLKHRGIISASVSGQAVTSVGLLPGTFTTVPGAA